MSVSNSNFPVSSLEDHQSENVDDRNVILYIDYIKFHRGEKLSSAAISTLQKFQFDKDKFNHLLEHSNVLKKIFYNREISLNFHSDGDAGHVSADLPILTKDGAIQLMHNVGFGYENNESRFNKMFGAKGRIYEREIVSDSNHLLKSKIPVTEEQYNHIAIELRKAMDNPPTYRLHGINNSNCIQWMDGFFTKCGIVGGIKNRLPYEKFKELNSKTITLQAQWFFDEFELEFYKATLCDSEEHSSVNLLLKNKMDNLKKSQIATKIKQTETDIELFLSNHGKVLQQRHSEILKSTLGDFSPQPSLSSSSVSEFSFPNPAASKPASKDDQHVNIALEIYTDLIHIRNHALGIEKEVPKLFRLPVVNFLAAMSANQGSKHPVRDSLVDMGAESAALTTMGLAIGDAPAAMTLFASHLAETGLHHFPTWDQIDKMPRSTAAERYAYSRMIEARAMGELLAWPSKAIAIISRFVKSSMDDGLPKLNPDKDLSSSNSLLAAAPTQFQQSPIPSLGQQDNSLVIPQSSPTIGLKATELSLSSPLVSQSLFAEKKPLELPKLEGLTDGFSSKTAWDTIRNQLSHSEHVDDKPYIPTLLPKLTGLSDGTEHKSAWDAIRSKLSDTAELPMPLSSQAQMASKSLEHEYLKQVDFPHTTLPSMQALQPRVFDSKPTLTEFSLGSAPRTAWNKLASSSQFSNHDAPGLPIPNAWDKVRDEGMNYFNKALRK